MTDLEVLIHEYGIAVLCEGKENLPRQIKRILEAARATPADHSREPVEPRPKMSIHRSFDTMCWPTPCPDLNEVSWRLTHGFSDQIDRLIGSSVIAAYVHLISMPAKRRNEIVVEVRKGPNTGAAIESQRSGDGS